MEQLSWRAAQDNDFARCHPLRKTLRLCVVLFDVRLTNDPSRVPTAAVKSRVTTCMYRGATHYMSTRHVTQYSRCPRHVPNNTTMLQLQLQATAAVISASNMLALKLQINCRCTFVFVFVCTNNLRAGWPAAALRCTGCLQDISHNGGTSIS